MLHMRRREFISLLGGAVVVWPLAARAQKSDRVYRIGVLETAPAASNAANFDALRKGLRELGYVEGKNLVLDYRSVDGRPERFPQLAAELLRLNVDLIVTRGTPAVMAAKNATETVPGCHGRERRTGRDRRRGRARTPGRKCHRPERVDQRIDREAARADARGGCGHQTNSVPV